MNGVVRLLNTLARDAYCDLENLSTGLGGCTTVSEIQKVFMYGFDVDVFTVILWYKLFITFTIHCRTKDDYTNVHLPPAMSIEYKLLVLGLSAKSHSVVDLHFVERIISTHYWLIFLCNVQLTAHSGLILDFFLFSS